MPAPNLLPALRWMQTTTSIIGTALGAPAVYAAASGRVSWTDAMPVLLGAVIAIAMPEKTAASPAQPASTTSPDKDPGQAAVPPPDPITQLSDVLAAFVDQKAKLLSLRQQLDGFLTPAQPPSAPAPALLQNAYVPAPASEPEPPNDTYAPARSPTP